MLPVGDFENAERKHKSDSNMYLQRFDTQKELIYKQSEPKPLVTGTEYFNHDLYKNLEQHRTQSDK
jgi:hypothetical protein